MAMAAGIAVQGAATPLEYDFLDMRFEKPFKFRGRMFPSAENAFQSTRFSDPETITKFQYMPPDTAAYKGAAFRTTVPDWEQLKSEFLRQVLRAKFSDPKMKKLLKSTGCAVIKSANVRHENCLGTCMCRCCRDRGLDLAGTALTELRASI
ncbi:MAG: NADAR family protein [Muribaculaceae bacterium]|nr:NADAR family protein [Muribaculaceae bacterium]